jgi:DNA-binding MarR family transcriptional regulator
VRSGLLNKSTCTDDLRRVRLTLTPEGTKLLARASTRRREVLAGLTEQWGAEDVDRLVELLSALNHEFDRLEATA